MSFTHKKLPSEREGDGEHTYLGPLRIETQIPKGGIVRFSVSRTFEDCGYKSIAGEIFNSQGKKCGEVKAQYFLKGDFYSWDDCTQATYEIWVAADASCRLEFLKQVLKVTNPLNKCLHAEMLWVETSERGNKFGVNTLLALFDYFHKSHGAKSMVAKMCPLQHLPKAPKGITREKKTKTQDIASLAAYLAKELNLTFFGEDHWIHGPTPQQRLSYPWNETGND